MPNFHQHGGGLGQSELALSEEEKILCQIFAKIQTKLGREKNSFFLFEGSPQCHKTLWKLLILNTSNTRWTLAYFTDVNLVCEDTY